MPKAGAGKVVGPIEIVGAAMFSEIVELVKVKGPVPKLLSVPVTVKVKVPLAVGVPDIVPLLPSEMPAGSAPLASVVEKV